MTDAGQAARSAGVVGILGGTFDPVHRGHLAIARHVRRRMRIPRLALLPASIPPHKTTRTDIASPEHRIAMLRLATARTSWLDIDTYEIDRGGVCFTLDTLRTLRRRRPRRPPVFVIGMDSLFEIDTWKNYRRLIREFDLIAVDRPGRRLTSTRRGLPTAAASALVELPARASIRQAWSGPPLGHGGRILYLPMPPVAISSRRIRGRVARGLAVDDLVPCAVARYIHNHRLYSKEAEP